MIDMGAAWIGLGNPGDRDHGFAMLAANFFSSELLRHLISVAARGTFNPNRHQNTEVLNLRESFYPKDLKSEFLRTLLKDQAH
jgi:hypothetical protein